MDAKVIKLRDDIQGSLDQMINRSSSSGAFARVYALYQNFQIQRFQTQNASEGATWEPYRNPQYAEYKRKRFRSYPGQGTKMLIATGTLAGAVIGRGAHPFQGGEKQRVIFKPTSMEISVDQTGDNAAGEPFNYLPKVNEERPVMEFSDDHLEQMKEEFAKFVLGF